MKNKSFWIFIFLILSICTLYCYATKHLDEIYAKCADYYFKKNNIEKSQSYYEKAFSLGFDALKQRERYVNSIINSPLNIEAQEKLIKFLENPKDDIAKLKAEYFLYDIKKEIHRIYSANYIANGVYNHKIMRWNKLPITFMFVNKEEAPEYFINEIKKAFAEWEKATDYQIIFDEEEKDANIIIKFISNNPADKQDKKYVVAYTVPLLNLDKLENMEINFYLKNSMDKSFTANEVYNTALHEIVHALGFMGHSDNRENVMYLTKDSRLLANNLRETLTESDINTVKLLYKIKPEITNIEANNSVYIPRLVLGSVEEVQNEKIEEALLYIKKAPNLPAGYISLAEEYVNLKNYSNAIKYLEKALILAETNDIKSMICFNLAVVNLYMENLEKSQKYIEQSIQMLDSDEKHYVLGEILTRNKKYKEAIEEYSKLCENNPENIDYLVALVNTYIIKREYFKARKELKRFFQNNPEQKNNSRFNSYGIIKLGL